MTRVDRIWIGRSEIGRLKVQLHLRCVTLVVTRAWYHFLHLVHLPAKAHVGLDR